MQLQGEKDSGKNNENSIDVTLNTDTEISCSISLYFKSTQKLSF